MIYTRIITLILIIFFCNSLSSSAQIVHDLLSKIKIEYNNESYYAVLNICRNIIELCKENSTSECSYTNVMKNVYRYKGLAEFEIYKKELKPNRLENAIQSLEISYNLYNDPEILFMYGYFSSLNSLLKKNKTNLDGLVKSWTGILELYGQNDWIVTKDLIDKIKNFIRVAEKFSSPQLDKNYSGKFAQYIILMACGLAEKAQLDYEDKKFFNKFSRKVP